LYKDYTRELNGVLVTNYLSYIHLANGLCYTNLAYSKEIYVLYTIDMWDNVITLEPSIMFCITHDYVIMTCDRCVTPCYVI